MSGEIIIPEIVTDPNQLVSIQKNSIQSVFVKAQGLIDIVNTLRTYVMAEAPKSVATASDRAKVASWAYKVSQSKVFLDKLGLDLVTDLKALPKAIDENRKRMRDAMDALRDEVRKDLDAWEAEQAEVEARLKAEAETRETLAQIERDHEFGLLLNAEFDRQVAETLATEEQARKDREAKIASEAREAERIKSEAAVRDAQEALVRAESERTASEQRAKDAEAREAQERAASAEREAKARTEAEATEKARAASVIKAEDDARVARESDKEHRRKFNGEAVASLVEFCSLNEDQARSIIIAIIEKKISHISISY